MALQKIILSNQNDPDAPDGVVALKPRTEQVKPPPLFQVWLLNDDYTPMEFVVAVLQKFFGKSREQATQIMLQVHHAGRGVCGVYPKDVAASKLDQVADFSKQHQHPLQCAMEEILVSVYS